MIVRNMRFALRQLIKSPGFTLTAAATLALGIGATTAIYTAVYATLLAPMPYPDPDQLVIVWSQVKWGHNGVSAGDFTDWREQSHSFVDLKAFTGTQFNLAGKAAPEMVDAQFTTPGMYEMMGTPFQLGRAMKSTLYGVGSIDLSAFFAMGALLMAAALLASYLPARRAAAVEPVRALRIE